jgi:hypothetical protein
MKDENYYQVSGWMVSKLGLKGHKLSVFAIIYGFCQDGESVFKGSKKYLCEWLGVSKPTVQKCLLELTEEGLIDRFEKIENSVTFHRYKINEQGVVKKLYPPSKNFTGGGKESLLGGGKESLPHNNRIDNTNRNNSLKEIEEKKIIELFPDLDLKRKSLFKNSLVCEFKNFEIHFKNEEFKNVDLNYYFNAVKDWSESSGTKRTSSGWIATARQFMRRDHANGKLKSLIKSVTDNEYLEYLKMGENGNS